MRACLVAVFSLVFIFLNGCAVLQEPKISKGEPIANYKYAVIPFTDSRVSNAGFVYGGQHGVYGSTTSKAVNLGSLIEGILLKKGMTSLDAVQPDLLDETLIVRYGESGRRDVAGGLGGYTLEVTIILVSAKTNETIYTCTAEGQGSTEADDIRQAISRCLSGI